jgi:hypothetical protein
MFVEEAFRSGSGKVMGTGEKPSSRVSRTVSLTQRGVTVRFAQLLIALAITAALALLAGSALQSSATGPDTNIVVNGNFETPVLSGDPGPGNWVHFPDSAVDGWSSITPGSPIEIMRGDFGPAADGVQYVELDSATGATGIYQDLTTLPGTIYRIDFQFAARPETPASDNHMGVYWDEIGSEDELAGPGQIQVDGTNDTEAQWTSHYRSTVATSHTSRLYFQYLGTQNSFGALLDDVRVYAPTCISVENGAWSTPETWQCDGIVGVPGPGNDVVIQYGHTIVLVSDAVADNLTIQAGGTLDNTGGHTLTVYGDVVLDGTYLKATTDPTDTVVFKGDKEQKVTGEKEEVEFNKVKVDKEKKTGSDEKSTVEFEKKLKVKKQTEIEKGKLKVGDAEFEGDVEIKQDGELEGTKDKKKTYRGDKTVDGKYTHNESIDEFNGGDDQKIKGGTEKQEKLEYHQLLIKKQQQKQAEFQKQLLIKQKTQIQEGKAKVGDAEFEGDVQIDKDGELEGTRDKKKTYRGDKTVDGKYTHNQSVDEFNGDKKQEIKGGTEKQSQLEYYQLLIKKQQQQQAEFQKQLLIKQKMQIQEGKAKVGDAEFQGDVKIDNDGVLEGTKEKTKTYYGDKTVDGTYTHNQSKDKFTGDKALQKLQGSKDAKYYEMELQKTKQNDLLDAMTKLQVEKQLRLIMGTLKTNTIFEDVIIEEGGVLILGEDEDPTQVRGNWTNDGEFDPGAGTVIFNGSDPQSIGGQQSTSFNNLEIQNSTTLEQKIVVNGTLKLNGPLTLGEGGEIEKGENFQIEIGAGGNLGIGCDPGNVKLTGGGWITSPAGAFLADPSVSGKANFNFPVHCGTGGTVPTGSLTFELGSAGLHLKSTSIDSMLVLGNTAAITGHGTLGGDGSYGFAAVAVAGAPGNSGAPNQFSIIIWDLSDGETIYDSDAIGDGPIATGGGNITLHTGSGNGPGGGSQPGTGPGESGPPGKGPGGNGPPGRR